MTSIQERAIELLNRWRVVKPEKYSRKEMALLFTALEQQSMVPQQDRVEVLGVNVEGLCSRALYSPQDLRNVKLSRSRIHYVKELGAILTNSFPRVSAETWEITEIIRPVSIACTDYGSSRELRMQEKMGLHFLIRAESLNGNTSYLFELISVNKDSCAFILLGKS